MSFLCHFSSPLPSPDLYQSVLYTPQSETNPHQITRVFDIIQWLPSPPGTKSSPVLTAFKALLLQPSLPAGPVADTPLQSPAFQSRRAACFPSNMPCIRSSILILLPVPGMNSSLTPCPPGKLTRIL